jgi:Mg2+ and Co2+ transporter CorA
MNTQLPDANNPNSFWHIIGIMILFGATLLLWFWRKGWIFEKEEDAEDRRTDK